MPREHTVTDVSRPRAATAADLDAVERLLVTSALPTDGVRDALDHLLVIGDGEAIVGVIGLELYGPYALLRSAAVARDARGSGIGAQLVGAILERARTLGVRDVYLLTTTAEPYFERHGFQRTSRDAVPDAVKASVEFRSACPASATVMVRSP